VCWRTVPKSWSGSCKGVIVTRTIEVTLATTGGGYKLAVISEILWSQVVKCLLHQDSELKLYWLSDCETSIELSQNWTDMFAPSSSGGNALVKDIIFWRVRAKFGS